MSDPTVEGIIGKIYKIEQDYGTFIDNIVKPVGEEYKVKFSPRAVAQNIIDMYNEFNSK